MGKRNSAWREPPKSKVGRYHQAAGTQRRVWAGLAGGDKLTEHRQTARAKFHGQKGAREG